MRTDECALLYSGGTDSTCAAALLAARFSKVHLLTFHERGTSGFPLPSENVKKLREKFGEDRFPHFSVNCEPLVGTIAGNRYLRLLFRHGLFVTANPAYSSLAWHIAAAFYCVKNGLPVLADGLTRELLQFPGHMDPVIEEFSRFHKGFGLTYENPVRDWPTPPDRQFLDRLLIDRHGFFPFLKGGAQVKTTGTYLYEQGLLPRPDVKGSALDHAMQHTCYPFIVFNLFVFWYYLQWHSYEEYERRMTAFVKDKLSFGSALLAAALGGGAREIGLPDFKPL